MTKASTHVLLIGAGAYPHVAGSVASVQALGLEPLSSPPVSAHALAEWFLGRGVFVGQGFHNPRAPLASLELLISPARKYTGLNGAEFTTAQATYANIATAHARWIERLKAYPENIGIFYFCGHGVVGVNDYLLPADFGSAPNPWPQAIDLTVTARAARREVKGPLYFLIDACRQTRAETLLPGASPSALGVVDFDAAVGNAVRLILWATGEGKAAFGETNQVSRFTAAVIEALARYRGEPEPDGRSWVVTGELLASSVRRILETENKHLALALHQAAEQQVIGSQPLHYQTERPHEVAEKCPQWTPSPELRARLGVLASGSGLTDAAREALAEQLEAGKASVETLPNEVSKWTQRYGELEDTLARLLDSAQTKAARALLEVGRLEEASLRARLLRSLQPPDYAQDIQDKLKEFEGRAWVFAELDDWLANSEASRVFWITGDPGVGKSALTAQIVQRYRQVVAFHACVHGNSAKGDPRRVAMSIAYQLAMRIPDYGKRLAKLDLERLTTKNAVAVFDGLLVQPFAAGLAAPDGLLVVVLDALDEAAADEATAQDVNALARFIADQFPRTPSWLRLVVTSRPEPEVVLPLQNFDPWKVDASRQENLDDLRRYIDRQLRGFGCEAAPRMIESIVDRSEGIFLYVIWVFEELRKKTLSLDQLDAFPRGLGGIYLQFFQRRFEEAQGDRSLKAYRERYRPMLELLASATEALSVDYISRVLDWSEYDANEVTGALGSLFPVTGDHVRPFHSSVFDWLQDRNKAGPFVIHATPGHKCHVDYGLAAWKDDELDEASAAYVVKHLAAHLEASAAQGWQDTLHDLLLDYGWIHRKLKLAGVNELIRDYERLPKDPGCVLLIRVLRQAAHILTQFPDTLAQRLFGCIDAQSAPRLKPLLGAVARCAPDELVPMTPSMQASLYLRRVLRGHEAVISHIALDANATVAVSASEDRTLRVWDLASGTERHVLRGHEGPVTRVALDANATVAVSASGDGTLRVWDLATGTERHVLRGHEGWVTHVALDANATVAVSASEDGTLRVWDLATGSERHVLRGHEDWVRQVALDTNATVAVSASKDGTLRVWDLASGTERHVLRGHELAVSHVALDANATVGLSASDDGTLRVWDLASGSERHVLRGHEGGVSHVALDANATVGLSASEDRTLRVWDLASGTECHVLRGHEKRVNHVALDADATVAVSASEDRTLRVWDLATGSERHVLRGHEGPVTHVSLDANATVAVSASEDRTLRVWDLANGTERHVLRGHEDRVTHVALDANATLAVSASYDRTLRLWDLATGSERHVLRGHEGPVTHVALDANATVAVSASWDGTLRVWDLASGSERHVLRGHEDRVTHVALDANATVAISASWDATLRVWDLANGSERHVLRGHERWVSYVALDANATVAISASWDRTLRVWDLANGSERHVLRGHKKRVTHVALDANATVAVSASEDQTLRVWDLASGTERHVLRGHEAWVRHVALDATATVAVSASWDRTLRVWDLANGTERHVLRGHEGPVRHVALDTNATVAVSAAEDRTLRVWDLASGTERHVPRSAFDHSLPALAASFAEVVIVVGDGGGGVHFLRQACDPALASRFA